MTTLCGLVSCLVCCPAFLQTCMLPTCLNRVQLHRSMAICLYQSHACCLQLLANLIRYLQSMKGRRLWSLEEQALSSASQPASAIALAGLVSSIAEAMQFVEELPVRDEAGVLLGARWAAIFSAHYLYSCTSLGQHRIPQHR